MASTTSDGKTGKDSRLEVSGVPWWEHSRWCLQILRRVKPKNPSAGIKANLVGSVAGNYLREVPRAIFVTNVDAFLSLSYRPVPGSS